MSWESILISMAPAAARLIVQSAEAALNGDHRKAGRLAEEAARQQSVRLVADEILKKSKK